jgi:cellulose synthase/poly-beta-1,6-N-acetylglucosamine synthase-like glycosyltransferase
MRMGGLRGDKQGYMLNVSPFMFVGYALIMVSMISFWFHQLEWFQGGIWVHIFHFSPVLVGAGVMVIMASKIFDPRWVIGIGLIASLTFYVLVIA